MVDPIFFALLLGATDPSVFVNGPPGLVEDVKRRVDHELDAVRWTTSSTSADLGFELVETKNVLSVSHAQHGEAVESRTVDIADREAAIRVVVLVVVNAIDRFTPLPLVEPPPPILPPAPPTVTATVSETSTPTPDRFRVGIGVGATAWNNTFTFQLAADVQTAVRIGPLWVGGRFVGARLCCTIAGDGIEADALTLAGTVDGALPFLFGDFDVGVSGGVGVAWDRVSAVAIFPGGRGLPEVTTSWGVAAHAEVFAHYDFGPLQVGAAIGAWLQPSPLTVRLPAPFGTPTETLTRGVVSPRIALEVLSYF